MVSLAVEGMCIFPVIFPGMIFFFMVEFSLLVTRILTIQRVCPAVGNLRALDSCTGLSWGRQSSLPLLGEGSFTHESERPLPFFSAQSLSLRLCPLSPHSQRALEISNEPGSFPESTGKRLNRYVQEVINYLPYSSSCPLRISREVLPNTVANSNLNWNLN